MTPDQLLPISTASAAILGSAGTLIVQLAWRAIRRAHNRRLARRLNAQAGTQLHIHRA
jgi:hypothetical protein